MKCSIWVLQFRICDESSQLHDPISKAVYEFRKTEIGIHGSGEEFEYHSPRQEREVWGKTGRRRGIQDDCLFSVSRPHVVLGT